MRMKSYDERGGKRVWLDQSEVQLVIDNVPSQSPEQEIGLKLGGRAGCRRKEAGRVTPNDVIRNDDGTWHLRIWEDVAKNDEYRETPVSRELATQITTYADASGIKPDEPVLDVVDKTLYRWVRRAAERCLAETGDDGWQYVDYHDLRRTWGTHVLEQGVLPPVVMSWGGWHDWETFREHYLGEFSPEAIRRERSKVDFLEGDGPAGGRDLQDHVTPISPAQDSSKDWAGD